MATYLVSLQGLSPLNLVIMLWVKDIHVKNKSKFMYLLNWTKDLIIVIHAALVILVNSVEIYLYTFAHPNSHRDRYIVS